MQVESFLTGKSFSIHRNINAKATDAHGAKVAKTHMDAHNKKKKMTVRLRPILKNATLAHITRVYMDDGGGKRRERRVRRQRARKGTRTCGLALLNSSNRHPPRSL
jgi:hypothetical protein